MENFFAENAQYRTAYALLDYGRSEPSMAGYQQVRRKIQDAMVDIFDGGDVDGALGKLQKEAEKSQEEMLDHLLPNRSPVWFLARAVRVGSGILFCHTSVHPLCIPLTRNGR